MRRKDRQMPLKKLCSNYLRVNTLKTGVQLQWVVTYSTIEDMDR